jgi:hypothetical protein
MTTLRKQKEVFSWKDKTIPPAETIEEHDEKERKILYLWIIIILLYTNSTIYSLP